MKKLLQARRKQDRAIQEFLSLASVSGNSCYKRLQELSRLDAVRLEENKKRQAVVVESFLSAVTEQCYSCCARLEGLTQLDARRFAEQEKKREAVAAFLSTVSNRASEYCERLEKLNQEDSAKFIEQKQAEAVKEFQSLNSFFLTEQQQELQVRDSEDEMSVLGLGKARGMNEKKRALNSHPKGQQGWKEEEEVFPDYENLEAGPLNNGMEDYDDAVQNPAGTRFQPEGYVLLTSPPAVKDQEEEEGPIYENLSRKSSSATAAPPQPPKKQLVRIHSQPCLGGEDEIMISAPPTTRKISEEQLKSDSNDDYVNDDFVNNDYVNDDIYVDTGGEWELADEAEEIYEDTSIMNQAGASDEVYDDLQSVVGSVKYDRADNFAGAVPHPQARFTSSAQYSEYNTKAVAGTLDGRVFGVSVSQQKPSDEQHLEDSNLYVDVSSTMSEMPTKNHVSLRNHAGKGRPSMQEPLAENETYVDLHRPNISSQPLPPAEGENSIYENAEDIRHQMASGLEESIEVGLPMVITQQQGSDLGRQRISITLHTTGNSPYDSEDYDDTSEPVNTPQPVKPPQQRRVPAPSSPKVPKRAPTTKLTTVPDRTSQSQGDSTPANLKTKSPSSSSISSNNSDLPHHSRYPSSDGDVFFPEGTPAAAHKQSAFLSPRMSKRRSALKAKSTSSISMSDAVKSSRKTSAPQMPGAAALYQAKKPLSQQRSDPLLSQKFRIQNKPLPPIPSTTAVASPEGDDIYDYADTGPTTLYEDPGEMKKMPSPYTSPVKKGGRLPLGKTKSVADVGSGCQLWPHSPPVSSAATISNRPPALLPATLSKDRPPAPLPADVTPYQPMGARAFREPVSRGTPPPKAGSATPPAPRSSVHAPPPQAGSATPPLPARNVVRTFIPSKANTPLPPLPPEASKANVPLPPEASMPPSSSPRMSTPMSPPNRPMPPLPFATTPLSPSTRATPPPSHVATPSPPLATSPARNGPPLPSGPRNTRSPKPPAGGAPPPLPMMENSPPLPPVMGTPPPPPPGMDGAPPPPPGVGGAPPPPPPPPVGGMGVKNQQQSATNQSPQPRPPPSTCRGSSELLSGIASVQLKKASDRPTPEPALPTGGGGVQGNLMSEMQSFKLKKRVTKTKSNGMDSKDQTDSPNPPGAFHFKLKPTSSVPFAGSQPPPVKTRSQGKSPPTRPGHEEVPEWKQQLQQKKQKKTSVPKVCAMLLLLCMWSNSTFYMTTGASNKGTLRGPLVGRLHSSQFNSVLRPFSPFLGGCMCFIGGSTMQWTDYCMGWAWLHFSWGGLYVQ